MAAAAPSRMNTAVLGDPASVREKIAKYAPGTRPAVKAAILQVLAGRDEGYGNILSMKNAIWCQLCTGRIVNLLAILRLERLCPRCILQSKSKG